MMRNADLEMRPGRDLDSSPGKKNVWVVTLLLRKLHVINKLESSAKVGN